MTAAEDRYSRAIQNEAAVKSQTNDKTKHAAAEKETADASAALSAERSGSGAKKPDVNIWNTLFGGSK
jgi:hypothetical protein